MKDAGLVVPGWSGAETESNTRDHTFPQDWCEG